MEAKPKKPLKEVARELILHRLPSCKELLPLISQSLERPLSLRERVVLKTHLFVCAWCDWYLRQLHLLRNTLRAAPDTDKSPAAPALSTEARERLKRALAQQKQ